MSLDEVVKEKNDHRDLDSQLRNNINALRVCMYGLKEACVSCSPRSDIAENKQNLIV